MKNFKYLYTCILASFSLYFSISCEKLIDVDLPNNQIASNEVFQDLQTANAALSALYADVMSNSPISGVNLDAALGVYTDELDEFSTTITPTRELYLNQQTDTNQTVYNIWVSSFKHIYTANAIIEGVDKSNGISMSDKKYLKGEALFIRTLMFFYLNQLWGDIPYPETTDYTINQILNKTPSNDALKKMVEDLQQVLTLLQDDYRNAERIYANKMTARLLLAKIYMAQKNWNQAEQLLKEITQSSLYQIETDITKVFQKSGKHILWQLKPINNASLKQATLYYFSNAKPSSYALNMNLVNSFNSNDLRKQHWMASVSYNGSIWYRAEKYKNRDNTNANEYSIIFRVEEAYLLLSESLAQQSKLTEGLIYLNSIRQRAGLAALTNLSQADLLNEILLEDRREFFTETGHRFLDLKRMDKLNLLSTAKPNWKDFHKLWPIPQNEILLNLNLKPQNNGY
ncbi:RagB/SusD family nutrient uptake outer membrane protein [Chryseobacterium indologenes]|uniref:RagB/SusD family nutrient uptake outer membrane protein n=4 Tax=Chryseobacterium TaxID=59732 RepID=A0A3G6RJC2_CHRLC|nr:MULTISPECIES: RagB/SusD family nutrient uptake outer membrane protein [Bacteroidota]AZA84527.1 RagB/SusD family nutrient uptake outer membrane protein [Chryseobacterium lactis]AZB04915.1 RagB/SusD family nutrient uptake outer membrane protein [Chryseobacterium lactis]KMQ64395.1 glycan metabolism protein RagB [Chryseobacterium angstadtii]MBF6643670.1 RagB/SusD family nutrient uptake outer membrane protein [Chryseobacterium indologenes]PNW14646.1 RagB/SusD family nutrient uptake outer membran